MKLEFSRQIFEKSSNIKFHESPVGAELFHSGGQTGVTKLPVARRSFMNAPNIRFEEQDLLLEFAELLK